MNPTRLNRYSLSFTLTAVGVLGLSLQGCGAAATIPSLAPVVKSALPAGLQPGAVAAKMQIVPSDVHGRFAASATMTLAQQYLTNLFQNYYAGSGGGSNVQGLLMSQVATVDARASLFNGKSSGCLSSTAAPLTLDYSAFNPTDTTSPNMLKFTLANVQCQSPFTGASGTAGISGEVFGQSGTNTSVWVTLGDMAGDTIDVGGAFIMMANLTNAGSTAATVNGLAFNYSINPQSASKAAQYTILRYKAVPSTTTFEMYFTANANSVAAFTSTGLNGGPAAFGNGFRAISDGTNIYSDGILCSDGTGTNCTVNSNWSSFQVCLKASDLSIVDPGTATPNCLTLANAFTLSPNATAFTSSQGVFGGGSPVTSPDPMVFTNVITGNAGNGDTSTQGSTDAMSAAQLTALKAVYKISTASTVAKTF